MTAIENYKLVLSFDILGSSWPFGPHDPSIFVSYILSSVSPIDSYTALKDEPHRPRLWNKKVLNQELIDRSPIIKPSAAKLTVISLYYK